MWGMATPAPLLFLDSSHVLQPRCLLSLLTPKCFISPAQPSPGEGLSPLSCASLLCGHQEEEQAQSWLGGPKGPPAQVSSLGSGVHSPPLPPHQTNAILSDLLWPLRHVLFLTPSWNWLSSSKNQVLFLIVPLT